MIFRSILEKPVADDLILNQGFFLDITKELTTLKLPIPPLDEQKRIVEILDKFETLTHSITEGLPKEIALREQQYEYYREQLLDFAKN